MQSPCRTIVIVNFLLYFNHLISNARLVEEMRPTPVFLSLLNLSEYFYSNISEYFHSNIDPLNDIETPSFWNVIPRSRIQMPDNSSNHEKLAKYFEGHQDELDEILRDHQHLVCPLSAQIFTDPVQNKEKGLPPVERNFIVTWLKEKSINPFNSQPLTTEDLIDCPSLKKEAYDFVGVFTVTVCDNPH